MKPYSIFRFTLYILVPFLLASCWTTSKFLERANYDTSRVPKDFDPRKHVLLVCEISRLNFSNQRSDSKTKQIDGLLRKYYPYKYEIVSLDDIQNNRTKYGDTTKYKYALLYYLSSTTHTTTTTVTHTIPNAGTTSYSVSPSARTIYLDFGFYDRANKLT